jgi:hypothetical protein
MLANSMGHASPALESRTTQHLPRQVPRYLLPEVTLLSSSLCPFCFLHPGHRGTIMTCVLVSTYDATPWDSDGYRQGIPLLSPFTKLRPVVCVRSITPFAVGTSAVAKGTCPAPRRQASCQPGYASRGLPASRSATAGCIAALLPSYNGPTSD